MPHRYSFVLYVFLLVSCRSKQLSPNKEQFINHLISFLEPVGDAAFKRLNTLLINGEIDSLNNTEGEIGNMIDGEFYDIFIYSNERIVRIKRAGRVEELEGQVASLIKFVINVVNKDKRDKDNNVHS